MQILIQIIILELCELFFWSLNNFIKLLSLIYLCFKDTWLWKNLANLNKNFMFSWKLFLAHDIKQCFSASSASLFTQMSNTHGWRSDDATTKSIIDLLVLEHGIRNGQTATTTEVQQQNTTWVTIREVVSPNHAHPGLAIAVHMRVEVPQLNYESPLWATSNTLPKDSKKGRYST